MRKALAIVSAITPAEAIRARSEFTMMPIPSSTTPNAVTAANYSASLMEQRSRDFFLDGHRMGDLRRYLKGGTDLWEKGAMYGTTTTFNDQTCWPINLAEVTNNPFVPKPYTPPIH